MSLIDFYNEKHLVDWYGAFEVSKGKGYLNAVSDLTITENSISALVQGTRKRPYHVQIIFESLNEKHVPNDGCSCPVRYGCKHVTAVLLKSMQERKNKKDVKSELLPWVQELYDTTNETTANKLIASKAQIYYLLDLKALTLTFLKLTAEEVGKTIHMKQIWSNVEQAILKPPQFINRQDEHILHALWLQRDKNSYYENKYRLVGERDVELLEQLINTNRLYLYDSTLRTIAKLNQGKPRTAKIVCSKNNENKFIFHTNSNNLVILPLSSLYYLDPKKMEIGEIQFGLPSKIAKMLLTLSPLSPEEGKLAFAAIQKFLPQLKIPKKLTSAEKIRTIQTKPIPQLILDSASYESWGKKEILDYAKLQMNYDEIIIDTQKQQEFYPDVKGDLVHVLRDATAEKYFVKKIKKIGFTKNFQYILDKYKIAPESYSLQSESAWKKFIAQSIPTLKKEGWEIIYSANFRHYFQKVDAWEVDLTEKGSDWLDVDMGIMVEGKRLSLAPLLQDLFKREHRWLNPKQLGQIPDNELITFFNSKGEKIGAEAGRIKPLVQILIDLLDEDFSNGLSVSKFDLGRLAFFTDQNSWQFSGSTSIKNMAQKLLNNGGIKPSSTPSGFNVQLRPYQCVGLAWLQYLREHQLSGILADDMGLGKTAQTLAHLLREKLNNRLQKPVLIVLPTSLVFNWNNEANRLAPQLTVLPLHGAERKKLFEKIPDFNIVLTTYPLLWRDEEELKKHEYYYLILDEAQVVKNIHSKASGVVRKIRTEHRLCLTGTPLENHLGELWSQFDFLLPGFLNTLADFNRRWRTPIEKHGDVVRRDLLAKRIKPFILRRRKEDVAQELPSKTIILRTVELVDAQRDLYETVRSIMDEKVRLEIANKGFKRSQIMILDALLKLRQVCCDPRLLKSTASGKASISAKLSLLIEILPEMIEEGRRVLIFSQFTEMLGLIEKELVTAKLNYVVLTGKTKNRQACVDEFQGKKVPIFLISLKAGGVGLNLTAADTVIHYDPWWNPAAENQATDRAHRLGQDKAVFVYKLIVAGSIEEKILHLQQKKFQLAEGILSADGNADVKFSEEDLKALLAPLPDFS